jgi:hypothetical protein
VTPLDVAFRAAEADGAPADARARFYALLMETSLCAPVEPAPEDAAPKPMVFALAEGPVALGFDDDARMAGFFGAPVEYVALPGRALVAALAEAGLGLGLNLGEAPSATLLDAATVRWLAAEMAAAPQAETMAGPLTVAPPAGAEAPLLAALAERLAAFPAMVAEAWLVRLAAGVGPARLTLLLLPSPGAARAAEGIAGALARAAEPFAPPGETVAVAPLAEGHPLLGPARARGVGLHPGPAPEPESPPPPAGPPRLR